MSKRKEKRECEECGISALETHLEFIKSENIYLCEYCLASSDYEESHHVSTYQKKGRYNSFDGDGDD